MIHNLADSILYFHEEDFGNGAFWHPITYEAHGFGQAVDSSFTLALPEDNWVLITNPDGNLLNKIKTENVLWIGDSLCVYRDGDWRVDVEVDVQGTQNDDIELRVTVNGVEKGEAKFNIEKAGVNGAHDNFFTYLVGVNKFDIISIQARNTKNSNSIVIVDYDVLIEWKGHTE